MKTFFEYNSSRRDFIKKGGILIASTPLILDGHWPWASSTTKAEAAEENKKENISPVEDLMREHGVLSRILLIYDDISLRLERGEDYPQDDLTKAARLIRRFVEEYHEKLEEDHVFPRFLKQRKLTDLVNVLLEQHRAGRRVTERIIKLSSQSTLKTDEKKDLLTNLGRFTRMYRPHKSREDTVLFPAFHSMIAKKEFGSLGDKFEEQEDKLFGEHGFEKIVEQVAGLEKSLNIYELSQFTSQ